MGKSAKVQGSQVADQGGREIASDLQSEKVGEAIDQPRRQVQGDTLPDEAAIERVKYADASIPLGGINHRHNQPRHVELQLTPPQSVIAKRLFAAANGETMRNGRRVQTVGGAIQWLLDNLAVGAEKLDWSGMDENIPEPPICAESVKSA